MKRNKKNTNFTSTLENFQRLYLLKSKRGFNGKIENLNKRLLRSGLKNFDRQPIVVVYLTPYMVREANENGNQERSFIKSLNKKLKGYTLLILPSQTPRIEVWNKGKIQPHISKLILELKTDPYEHQSFQYQAEKGIQNALAEAGLF